MKIGSAPSHVRTRRAAGSPELAGAELVLAGDPELFGEAEGLLLERMAEPGDGGEFQELGHLSVYVKGGPLAPAPAKRHGRALRFLHRHPPRRREFENLCWLRRSGFEAAEPVLAAYARRKGRILGQLLVTVRVDRAGSLRPLLETGLRDPLRGPVLDALARTVGDMHAKGFGHGDLYPRNLLYIGGKGSPVRIVLLDAWRGGPTKSPRVFKAAARDLGCFFLHGAEWLSEQEQLRFVRRYRGALREHRISVDEARLRRAIERGRAREQERFAGDVKRHRDLPGTTSGWKLAS